MPGGDGLGPRVRDNNDGTICVEYEPKKEGRHEVIMTHDGSGVKGQWNTFVVIFGCYNDRLAVSLLMQSFCTLLIFLK
ncbi:hypothetical protein BaRGS_00010235 [Batillaria attramentaria]|uniref:Uncharacterized protein n=1 Tax=Batillaria attramentaria TaxID=370345 RepID=A0ABD0LGK5_9CAEN